MEKVLESNLNVQDLTIVITAQQLNPTMLTPDFLQYSGIVPTDWTLAQPPRTGAPLIFQNGVRIQAQANRVVFSEPIAAKETQEVMIPAVARKYIETLPNVSYQALGINLLGFVPFAGDEQGAHDYIFKRLLATGPWSEFGKARVGAALKFTYALEQAQLNLDINEARLRLSKDEEIAALLFAANFNWRIAGQVQSERLAFMGRVVGNWAANLKVYRDMVNSKFLGLKSEQAAPEGGEAVSGASNGTPQQPAQVG